MTGLNIHEFKPETLLEYTGDFELNGSMIIGTFEHKTKIRFRNMDPRQDVVEYTGNNCYIPTSGNCFIECNKYFTKKGYSKEFLTFIRNE